MTLKYLNSIYVLCLFVMIYMFYFLYTLHTPVQIVYNYKNPPVIIDLVQQEQIANKHYQHLREWEALGTDHGLGSGVRPSNPTFNKFSADYPCFFGEQIGASLFNDENSNPSLSALEHDGIKYLCGVHLINNECIVYSIGSDNQYHFEQAVYGMNSNCKIFVFDHTVQQFNVPLNIQNNVISHNIGIGHRSLGNKRGGNHIYTLPKMMSLYNHSHIDILKIDVEGNEFLSLFYLDKFNRFPSIGQLLLEIHVGYFLKEYMKRRLVEWGYFQNIDFINDFTLLNKTIHMLEKYGLRIFHKEVNEFTPEYVIEYAFIQQHWRANIRNYSIYLPNNNDVTTTKSIPIVVTLTTIPVRLKSNHFKKVMFKIINGTVTPDIILLNIPPVYVRTNETYSIPDWIHDDYEVSDIIKINHCEKDMGPITKLFGGFDKIKDNWLIIPADDDIIHSNQWIENLVLNYYEYNISNNDDILVHYDWGVYGYAGYIVEKKSIKNIMNMVKKPPKSCYFVDDDILSWYYKK
eukprot:323772_1